MWINGYLIPIKTILFHKMFVTEAIKGKHSLILRKILTRVDSYRFVTRSQLKFTNALDVGKVLWNVLYIKLYPDSVI